jgi:Cu/Ag efflux protein CusF
VPVQRHSDHQENTMRQIPLYALAALLALAGPAWAQSVKATVTKVDQAAGKVTLDHERIPKLDMDAMTMAYKVKDPAMIKDLKSGDKVDFEVDEADGQYTVTKIRKAK